MHPVKEIKEDEISREQQATLRIALEHGLPLVPRPYELIAQNTGLTEPQVLQQIERWQINGLIRRYGLVVKHRELGYTANAMVVWNIEDEQVDSIAEKFSQRPEVSLCYRRPRRLPHWPYNLFCMIHGQSRELVKQQIQEITQSLNLKHIEKSILFSNKAYKQNGARYIRRQSLEMKAS